MKKPTLHRKLRMNSYWLPIICGILFILSIVDSYRGWKVLLISLGGVLLISYFWVRKLTYGLTLQREVRFGWQQVGDYLEERFTLTNQSNFPAFWVEIIDQTNMPNYNINQVRDIGPNSKRQWYVRSLCSQRGLFVVGPTRIRTMDPFGIFSITIEDPAQSTMMVMPPVVSLPPIQVAPGGRVGEGTPRVNAPERTVSSASVREYVPGDSLRWVHWKTSARRDELFVRIFEGTPAGDWWIILDLDESAQVGEGLDSTGEHGIILAASLANLGMRAGKSVGLITLGEELVWLPPKMSDDHLWSILHELALVKLTKRPLSELLDLAQPSLGRNTSLILITPGVDGEWIENLLAIRRQQVIPTVLIYDPVTFGGDKTTHQLQNMLFELGIVHDVIPADLLKREEIQPGKEGHWEWKVTPLGKAIPVKDLHSIDWESLS